MSFVRSATRRAPDSPDRRCGPPNPSSDVVLYRRTRPECLRQTLHLNGYEAIHAVDALGNGTDDRRLLAYCGDVGHLFVTHDKKDFDGSLGNAVAQAGIVIYSGDVFTGKD